MEIVQRIAKEGDEKYSYKRFSSEKSALNYIIKNKKCLDVQSIITKLRINSGPASLLGPYSKIFTLFEIENLLKDMVEKKIKITHS